MLHIEHYKTLKINRAFKRFGMVTQFDKSKCPYGVMIRVQDCSLVVCESDFRFHYHVHLRNNTLGFEFFDRWHNNFRDLF